MREYKTSLIQRKNALCRYYKNRKKELKRLRVWVRENREKRAEYFRKYRTTKKGKEATLRAIRKYESNHPWKKKVWNKSRTIKMKPCSICGKYPAHRHHHNYNKPLEVIFLCPLHHKEFKYML